MSCGSSVLDGFPEGFHRLCGWLGTPDPRFHLVFRSSVHGVGSTAFRRAVGSSRRTVTIALLSDGSVVGGYNPEDWNSSRNGYIDTKSAFVFRLYAAGGVFKPYVCNSTRNSAFAVHDVPNQGPVWGENELAFFNAEHWGLVCNLSKAYHPPGDGSQFVNGAASSADPAVPVELEVLVVDPASTCHSTSFLTNGFEATLSSWLSAQLCAPSQGLPHKFNVVFRASDYPVNGSHFWTHGAGINNALFIGRLSNGYIVGGFAPTRWNNWTNNGIHGNQSGTFLFRLSNGCVALATQKACTNTNHATYHFSANGPCFGGGNDMVVQPTDSRWHMYSGLCYYGSPSSDGHGSHWTGHSSPCLIDDWEIIETSSVADHNQSKVSVSVSEITESTAKLQIIAHSPIPVASFTVDYWSSDSDRKSITSPKTSCVLTGLSPATNYNVEVRVNYASGVSATCPHVGKCIFITAQSGLEPVPNELAFHSALEQGDSQHLCVQQDTGIKKAVEVDVYGPLGQALVNALGLMSTDFAQIVGETLVTNQIQDSQIQEVFGLVHSRNMLELPSEARRMRKEAFKQFWDDLGVTKNLFMISAVVPKVLKL